MHKWICVLWMLVFVAGCAPAAPAAPGGAQTTGIPPTAAASQPTTQSVNSGAALVAAVKPGEWAGTGNEGFTITFTVNEGGSTVAKGIRILFAATCGTRSQQVSESIAATEDNPIQAGVMHYKNSAYDLAARAVAADRIEGTLKVAEFTIGKLGQCKASDIVWTASPK